MAELYLDQLVDLLLPEEAAEEPPPLSVHVDSQGMVYVQNVTELAVADAAQTRAALLTGLARRNVQATAMNAASSRSHLVFAVIACYR